VKVIVAKSKRREFQQGKRYLEFVMFHPDSGMAMPLVSLEVLDDGTLAAMVKGTPGSDWRQVFNGLSLDSLLERVKQVVRRSSQSSRQKP
jgi:hypothetical protein